MTGHLGFFLAFIFSSKLVASHCLAPLHIILPFFLLPSPLLPTFDATKYFCSSLSSDPEQLPAAPTHIRAPAEGAEYDGGPADSSKDLQPQSTQQCPVSLTHVHRNTHTLSYTKHTQACMHISCPLVPTAATAHTTKSFYSWCSCVWCCESHKQHTQRLNRASSLPSGWVFLSILWFLISGKAC